MLGFPLHHGPTKGGAAEGHKFRDWYGHTLQAYHAAFGTLPPADPYGPPSQRRTDHPRPDDTDPGTHHVQPAIAERQAPAFTRQVDTHDDLDDDVDVPPFMKR